MSRSGYSDDMEDSWALIRWRGAVESAIKGRRGQEFLREMLECLDSMPEKKLIEDELITPGGEVCAIGSVMKKRGIDTSNIDVYDADKIAEVVGIAPALVREIEYINDEEVYGTALAIDEKRWKVVRNWVVSQLKDPVYNGY